MGVEFQFYLVWPLVCPGVFRLPLFWQPLVLLSPTVASYTWMGIAASGLEGGYLPRVYLGTDTRIGAIILGVALAQAMSAFPRSGRIPGLSGVSLVGFVLLLTMHFLLEESLPALYQGGFAVVAVLSAAVIGWTLANSSGMTARFLGSSLMTAIGRRAFSLYLWHWPVFCLSQSYVDIPLEGATLFLARLVATVMLSELSYRVVEMPFRGGKVLISLREIWADPDLRPVFMATTGLYWCLTCVLGIAVLNPASSMDSSVTPDP
ncbi:MAG: acyltransferase [Gammaproteobacteria bacterium]|nr:acyltransferase [Gammaproteobacteria bacterium]